MNEFQDVKTFAFFIGYPRSGHSLVGACLDAHPNAIISHELDALTYLEQGATRTELFQAILKRSRWFFDRGNEWSGYSYRIPGMYQGTYKNILVIGDKRGGLSSKLLEAKPELLDLVRDLEINYKMIHVVKNPYDCISTSVKMQEKIQQRIFSPDDIQRKIDEFFSKAKTIMSVIKKEPENVLTIRYETLLSNPKDFLSSLCNYLGLEPMDDYLKACSSIIWKTGRPSRLRSDIWDLSFIEKVQSHIDQYNFFEGYTFQSE